MPLLISDWLRGLYTAFDRNNNLEGQIGFKAKRASFNRAHMHRSRRAEPVVPKIPLARFEFHDGLAGRQWLMGLLSSNSGRSEYQEVSGENRQSTHAHRIALGL
jgi:hypothetical protein